MKRIAFALMACFALCSTSCVKDLEFLTLSVECYPSDAGTIVGAGSYLKGTTATLEAIPAEGYVFVGWSDGNTDNPRTVTVTADADYSATFEPWTGTLQGTVTFDGYTWTVGTESFSLNSDGILGGWLAESGQHVSYKVPFPCVYLFRSECITLLSTGKYSFSHNDLHTLYNSKVSALQYFQSQYSYYEEGGDWYAESAEFIVSALDLNSRKMRLRIEAVMYDAINRNNTQTRNLTVNLREVDI